MVKQRDDQSRGFIASRNAWQRCQSSYEKKMTSSGHLDPQKEIKSPGNGKYGLNRRDLLYRKDT